MNDKKYDINIPGERKAGRDNFKKSIAQFHSGSGKYQLFFHLNKMSFLMNSNCFTAKKNIELIRLSAMNKA